MGHPHPHPARCAGHWAARDRGSTAQCLPALSLQTLNGASPHQAATCPYLSCGAASPTFNEANQQELARLASSPGLPPAGLPGHDGAPTAQSGAAWTLELALGRAAMLSECDAGHALPMATACKKLPCRHGSSPLNRRLHLLACPPQSLLH